MPGDWNSRLAPSHEFISHFNRAPRKPHTTVPSRNAGETLDCDWIVEARRGAGARHVTLRLPHCPDAPEATRFPAPLTLTTDGPVPPPGWGE